MAAQNNQLEVKGDEELHSGDENHPVNENQNLGGVATENLAATEAVDGVAGLLPYQGCMCMGQGECDFCSTDWDGYGSMNRSGIRRT